MGNDYCNCPLPFSSFPFSFSTFAIDLFINTQTMKSLHSLLFCGVLLLHASCSGIKTSDEKSLDDCPLVATWKQAGTDSIVVLDVGLIKDTMQIRLSQLVDDLEIIKLETRDTALVKSGYMAVSDRYMLLGSYLMPCKLFDKNGTFRVRLAGLGKVR